jgi:conjugative transfer signal peptidase TraF
LDGRRSGRPPRGLPAAAGVLAAVAAIVLVATLLWDPPVLLVWNASASSPVGLYRIGPPGHVETGDMVLARPPDAARRLGAERHYLPWNVPLVKRVGAVAGDEVCAFGEAVFVNGRFQSLRRRRDGLGRPMPWWSGCVGLGEGEVFLHAPDSPDSFDGRYFGTTAAGEVIGSARLIWAR